MPAVSWFANIRFGGSMQLLENQFVSKIKTFGEEKVGQIANQLLSNETFVNTLQSFITKSINAKTFIDKNIQMGLSTINVPSFEDIERLQQKIDGLEVQMEKLALKVEQITDIADEETSPKKVTAKAKNPQNKETK